MVCVARIDKFVRPPHFKAFDAGHFHRVSSNLCRHVSVAVGGKLVRKLSRIIQVANIVYGHSATPSFAPAHVSCRRNCVRRWSGPALPGSCIKNRFIQLPGVLTVWDRQRSRSIMRLSHFRDTSAPQLKRNSAEIRRNVRLGDQEPK